MAFSGAAGSLRMKTQVFRAAVYGACRDLVGEKLELTETSLCELREIAKQKRVLAFLFYYQTSKRDR